MNARSAKVVGLVCESETPALDDAPVQIPGTVRLAKHTGLEALSLVRSSFKFLIEMPRCWNLSDWLEKVRPLFFFLVQLLHIS